MHHSEVTVEDLSKLDFTIDLIENGKIRAQATYDADEWKQLVEFFKKHDMKILKEE